MKRSFLPMLLFLAVPAACFGAEEKTAPVPAAPAPAVQEEGLPDFSSLRDPFLPQLPIVKEINERPVEPGPKIDDNNRKPPAVSPQQPKLPRVPVKPPALKVQGIIWDSDRPQAIINGEIVDVGQVVADAKIVSIQKEGVDFLFHGEKFHASMEE